MQPGGNVCGDVDLILTNRNDAITKNPLWTLLQVWKRSDTSHILCRYTLHHQFVNSKRWVFLRMMKRSTLMLARASWQCNPRIKQFQHLLALAEPQKQDASLAAGRVCNQAWHNTRTAVLFGNLFFKALDSENVLKVFHAHNRVVVFETNLSPRTIFSSQSLPLLYHHSQSVGNSTEQSYAFILSSNI